MNKAVFLLCPADHLCPSQMGGLDLDLDLEYYYYYYYYSVSKARSAGPSPGRLECSPNVHMYCGLENIGRRGPLVATMSSPALGPAREAPPRITDGVHQMFTRHERQAPPATRRRLNLYPTISPRSSAVTTGVPVK